MAHTTVTFMPAFRLSSMRLILTSMTMPSVILHHLPRTRMRSLVRLAQASRCDVGINLGSRQAAMTKELLDRTDVGTTIEQMRREAVPQRMGAGPGIDAGHVEILGQ